MGFGSSLIQTVMVTVSCFVIGCSLSDQYAKNTAPVGFITTPPSYYSSAKARSLGMKYKENLDRLAERIVRNPRTGGLQFANNLSSVGGIGFFTHSAASIPDERYLEVIVSTPESFEGGQTFEVKVAQVFAVYGKELLSILAADSALSEENDLSGYGLNLTWRSIVQTAGASRIVVEGAILYFKKGAVGSFLQSNMDQVKLLSGAVIFAAEESGALRLVSYRETEQRADRRLPLYEESLDVARTDPQIEPRGAFSQAGSRAALVGIGSKHQTADEARQKQTATSNTARMDELQEGHPVAREQVPEGWSGSDGGFADSKGKTSEKPLEHMDFSSAPAITEKGQRSRINELSDEDRDSGKAEERPDTDQGAAGQKPLLRIESPAPGTSNSVETTATQTAVAEGLSLEERSSEKITVISPNTALRVQPPEIRAGAQLPPKKTLEGYVIQVGFDNKSAAQNWAEKLERRGYAVSLTETDGEGLMRLRLGNFAVREEAERQLKVLKDEGLRGFVINLPQAYRPEQRANIAEKSAQPARTHD